MKSFKLFSAALIMLVCFFSGAPVHAAVINGLTFSVNNSESGNYFWSNPSTGSCNPGAGEGCAEVGGGFVFVPPDFNDTAREIKRGMSEFDLSGVGLSSQATLSFDIFDNYGQFIQGSDVTANIFSYQGNNVGELSDWGAATTALLGKVSVSDCFFGQPCPGDTVSLDITAIMNNAVQSGWTSLGIRLQSTSESSDRASQFHNFSIDTVAISAVPVPATAWLFLSGLLSLTGIAHARTRNAT